MEAVEKKRRWLRWAMDLLIWCGPTLALLTAFVWIPGFIPDKETLPTLCLILLLGLIVTRLIFLFRSHRTVGGKAWRTVVWLALLFALLFVGIFFPIKIHRSTKADAQSKFEATVAKILPEALSAPLELGSPKTVMLHKYLFSMVIFQTNSYTLLCQYDAGDYEAAKAALEAKYSFRTDLLQTQHPISGREVPLIEPHAQIGDDFFRFLCPPDGDTESWEFYKRSLLMVTNDTKQEIGFILFDDIDLDVAEDLAAFLNEYCGWKCIR